MIGYAFCASFCTLERSLEQLNTLKELGYDILPIVSENVFVTDTRFGMAAAFRQKIINICGKGPIHSIVEAEKIGPSIKLDALIVSPCTGNTLAKFANGITDSCVSMAIKAQLRNQRPVVIALASNDALSANLKNIGLTVERKNVYYVPMYQDDPIKKPHSLISDFTKIPQTLELALKGEQYQPLFQVIDRA